MHAKLAQAMNLLFKDFKKQPGVQPKDLVEALFSIMHMAGYFSREAITKAVTYLHAEKPFTASPEDLIESLDKASKPFHFDRFTAEFGNIEALSCEDLIEIISFLQQTAFDRAFGEERDRLEAKPWMLEQRDDFIKHAKTLGLVDESTPSHEEYIGTGIMGAASIRVKTRIEYVKRLADHIKVGKILALSGNRELSKGLDEEDIMEAVAQAVTRQPANYKEKPVGTTTRVFCDDVTETHMVNYLLQNNALAAETVESAAEEDHWRATTTQNAKDVVPIILNEISQRADHAGKAFEFMIIAEQPHSQRMAMQVQREFNAQIEAKKLPFTINVEGCGQGLRPNLASCKDVNSSIASLMAECYNNAKLNPHTEFTRDPSALMFAKRDERYGQNLQKPEMSNRI